MLIQTDLPDPVVPAISKCGIEDKSLTIGLPEIFDDAISLVEWPDRLENSGILPPPNLLKVDISVKDVEDSSSATTAEDFFDPQTFELLEVRERHVALYIDKTSSVSFSEIVLSDFSMG